jgi:hypothetical protein
MYATCEMDPSGTLAHILATLDRIGDENWGTEDCEIDERNKLEAERRGERGWQPEIENEIGRRVALSPQSMYGSHWHVYVAHVQGRSLM